MFIVCSLNKWRCEEKSELAVQHTNMCFYVNRFSAKLLQMSNFSSESMMLKKAHSYYKSNFDSWLSYWIYCSLNYRLLQHMAFTRKVKPKKLDLRPGHPQKTSSYLLMTSNSEAFFLSTLQRSFPILCCNFLRTFNAELYERLRWCTLIAPYSFY